MKNITVGIEKGLKLYLNYQKISNTQNRVAEIGAQKEEEFKDYVGKKFDEIAENSNIGLIVGIVVALLIVCGIVIFLVFRRRMMQKKVPIGTHEHVKLT